jgi:hypothetical protein
MFWNTKKFVRERLSLKMLKHAAPVLSPLTQEQIKQRVLVFVQSQPAEARAEVFPNSYRFHFAKLTAASAFGALAIVGTAYASTAANPGDILYPVKRAQETVRLTLVPSEESKAELQAEFAQERITEFKNVTKSKNSDVSSKAISSPDIVIQNTAKKEVKNALHNLKISEINLKQHGKIKASLSVLKKIDSIESEAKKQNLIGESTED